MKTEWNGSYCIKIPDVIIKYKDIIYETKEKIPAWAIINSSFELIEEDTIDIDSIEETEIKNDGMKYFEYENNGATESGYSKIIVQEI